MSTEQKAPGAGVQLAAGALVWSEPGAAARVAIVRREKHADWALPKGRPEAGESLAETAAREAGEETRVNLELDAFAGTYSYTKDGQPKHVLIWHAWKRPGSFAEPAAASEIAEVAWLPPAEAIQKLSYDSERELLQRHAAPPAAPVRRGSFSLGTPEIDPAKRARLKARLFTTNERLRSALAEKPGDAAAWWTVSARRSLATAQSALDAGELDLAWSAVHDTERVLVFCLSDAQLIARATNLQTELAAKLRGWRRDAALTLFNGAKLADLRKAGKPLDADQRAALQFALIETLAVFNEHTDNIYHRIGLVSGQLQTLVRICGALLVGALFAAWKWAPADSEFSFAVLLTVMLAGALGGVASTMYQLSRVGEAKIPEALLHGLITTGRPLVGAASALFIYAVYRSGIVSFFKGDPALASLTPAVVLGFVAGFSEKFVLGAVAKVSAPKEDEKKPSDG